MLAIIPTINKSEYLPELLKVLRGDGVDVIVIDGTDIQAEDPEGVLRLRHKWNIYKTWNYGLDMGITHGHETVFVLNDDIVATPGSFVALDSILKASGFAIISFEDPNRENHRVMREAIKSTKPVAVSETTAPASEGHAHGICGYAWAANPHLCARADEGYIWYCGDDDLFYSTARKGHKIGVAHGVQILHPDPMHSSKNINEIMPEGWQEHDIARIRDKWGSMVSQVPKQPELFRDIAAPVGETPNDKMPERPEMFIGIPSHDGKISAPLHVYLSSITALSALGQFPFAVNVCILTGITPVQYARNRLLNIARTTDAERIVLIDDDMLPDETCTRVMFSQADICVPRMYRFRHNGPDALTPEENKPPEIASCATLVTPATETEDEKRFDVLPQWDKGGIFRVQAAGTGFIMIKRKVIEDPRMLVGPPDPDGTPALFQIKYSATGHILEWEDVDFTLRANNLGYVVAADMSAHCGHRKAINLDCVAEMLHYAALTGTTNMAALKKDELERELQAG